MENIVMKPARLIKLSFREARANNLHWASVVDYGLPNPPSMFQRDPMSLGGGIYGLIKLSFVAMRIFVKVGSEVDSDVSLNDYLRNYLNLRGTKYMCKEGGCGACIVAITARDSHGHKRTFSVNSCLVSVTSCQDWEVTTVEGIGDRRKGYHPIQKTLAEHDGTQCGHCSPGWVMGMYSLLESQHYNLTMYEIENSFGSNVCRCTGYRPILDAFKTFAKDAPKPNKHIDDIEDLRLCKNKGNCKDTCENKEWCIVEKSDIANDVLKIKLKDDRVWYRVNQVKSIFEIFELEGIDSYMLVNGNTGRGAVPILKFPRVLIDIQSVQEIKGHYLDQNLVIGAGTTLTELMEICITVSKKDQDFFYLEKFYEHLDLVAHIPVRNIGSIAGNLMVKHREPRFSSDIFLLLESVGAILTIVGKTGIIEVLPEQFSSLDMSGRVITLIKLPPLSSTHQFVSFKIMPRSQNAHAAVNGAFLYEFVPHSDYIVASARIVITGLSAEFVHARKTEEYLVHKKLFTNDTLQKALSILQEELIVTELPGELSPEYRKKCALGIFYKGLLILIPQQQLKPIYRSGARYLRRTRPLSRGTEVYDTNPVIWPITEPMPKVEALIQCAGEAKYSNDLPTQPQEVFCAFVTSDICTGEILEIDPSPALKLPGVLAFLSAKDIIGENTFLFPANVFGSGLVNEEIFADKEVKYYDQPIGVIVAETEKLANRAALLVHVKYNKDKQTPILTIDQARARDPSRVKLFFTYPARDKGLDVRRVLNYNDKIEYQYHFTMETLSTVAIPNDDGLHVFASTQWPDLTQKSIASAINMEQNRVYLEILRCGGSYGSRISRGTLIATVCSLASYYLNRPCRFVMSIQANIRCIGKRPPVTKAFECGINDRGEIQYLEYQLYTDVGYVFTEPILGYTSPSIKSCYNNSRWHFTSFSVTTDTAQNTYARAPGILEGICHTEYVMEHIAYELDMDPLQVRLNNLDPQRTDVAEMIQTLVRDSQYYKRQEDVKKYNNLNRWKKRGLGIALMSYPISAVCDYSVMLTVFHGDASVTICHGGVEIGQGINTKLIQIAAYNLNISTSKINVKSTDTVTSPNAFTTGGSRTTEIMSFAVIKCCQLLLDRLSVLREELNNPTWEILIQTAYIRGIGLQVNYTTTPNDFSTYRVGGVALAEVELDILTGEHDVTRVDIVEDVGTSTNPTLDIGQIEGAFIMGMGYFTSEHQIYDEKTGEILTDRTWNYHVPLAKDIPIDFRIQLRRNSYNPLGTLGSKGVSEPPICLSISVIFALRDAIAASRLDTGYPRNKWFDVDGPFTLEANVLKADARLNEFLFN